MNNKVLSNNGQDILVSIILPIYNVGMFFGKCMQSVVGQSYKNLEIILVDDGSTDNSGMIADDYSRSDNRIKVIHQNNSGVSTARNRGIDAAHGEYVCFSDPDDVLQPDYVEYMLELCLRYRADIAVCAEVFTPFKRVQPSPDVKVISGEDAAAEILYGKITVGCYSKMFKRTLLNEKSIRFYKDVKIGEGFNFNVLAFCHSENVVVSQHKVYYYRLDNANSAMSKFSIEKCKLGLEAIDIIRDNLVIKSDKLLSAVDFAEYSTLGSMFDWMVMANARQDYPKLYNDWSQRIKSLSKKVISAPTSRKLKVAAVIRSVSPFAWAYIRSLARKIVLSTKTTAIEDNSKKDALKRRWGGVNLLCTGCRACELKCSHHAITMIQDEEGFLCATIDMNKCTGCGLCLKICPQSYPVESHNPIAVYALRDKDDDEIYKSASGGAFAVLARTAIEKQNAVVFGAAYTDKDLHVGHIAISGIEKLSSLQGSKYVQSNTLETFKEVKSSLGEERRVIYTGTPCQIAGLKAFLQKDYANLLTVDLICHGVPSPLLFEKYLSWLSVKYSKVVKYDFRDKSGGWGLNMKAILISKTVKKRGILDPYYYHFLEGNTYRECCYYCRYCRKERVGDITIGDYWGIEVEHPDFLSTKGISCVLINTPKGIAAFDEMRGNVFHLESSFDKIARHNGNLLHPTHRKFIRNIIYDGIEDKALEVFFKNNLSFPVSIRSRAKAIVPMKTRLFIKKMSIKWRNH